MAEAAAKIAANQAIADGQPELVVVRLATKAAKDANGTPLEVVMAAGHAAAEAATAKHGKRDQVVRAASTAAIEAAVELGIGEEAAQVVANLIRAVGGTQADVSRASADAVVSTHPDMSREVLTDTLFRSWDKNGNGNLEFEEVLPHYLQASNHLNLTEEQVRQSFGRFMEKQGKQKTDGLTREVFGVWMARASMLQLSFQYCRAVGDKVAGRDMMVNKTKAAVEAAGGNSDDVVAALAGVHRALDGSKAPSAEETVQTVSPQQPVEPESKAPPVQEMKQAEAPSTKKPAAVVVAEEEEKGKKLEEKYEKLFDEIDSRKAGVLTNEDIEKYFGAMSPVARAELGIGGWRDFLKEADIDGNGQVDKIEFVVYFTHVNLEKERCYAALFDAIDADGDGHCSMEEVRDYEWHGNAKLFQMLGVANWHAMVAKMDTDGDGQISRQEFLDYMSTRLLTATDPGTDRPRAAWKHAPALPQRAGDGSKCWDYSAGYCYRGSKCRYAHEDASVVDQAVLDAHWRFCMQEASAAGVNLSTEALDELQTLTEADAKALILSIAHGGDHESVFDKNHYVVHTVRRTRMKAASKEHPDHAWYHGPSKRRRIE